MTTFFDTYFSEADKKWIQGAIKKPGALHKQLGVPEGQKIPLDRLKSAANSSNKTLARRARLALTMRGFKKGDKK